MNDRIGRFIAMLDNMTTQMAIKNIVNPIADRLSTHSINTAGLAIKSGGSAIVKTGATAWCGIVQGKLQTKGAATDMPALAGTVVNATFNVFCFFIDVGGTVTSAMGTPAATLVNVKFPPFPEGKALVGFIIVNPTGTGDFVGGTTALDDGTVAPNVVYVNMHGGLDPSVLL